MAQRGRKSTAALAMARPTPVLSESRLAPPIHLPDAERDVWLQVVNDQPASSFTETHAPMLELYCRHVVLSRILADELLNFDRAWIADDDGLKRYDRLLAMHERESRAASSAATRPGRPASREAMALASSSFSKRSVPSAFENHLPL